MDVSENVIKNLGGFLIEHQEADIVAALAEKTDATAEEALSLYYQSDLAPEIERGELGLQYLPADYLADEVLKRKGGLPHLPKTSSSDSPSGE